MADLSANVTLEEGAWLDSFDKLLAPRNVLREKNIIKKNVRASFNNNSSVVDESPLAIQAPRPKVIKLATDGNGFASNPFKCSLSPVGAWRRRATLRQVTNIVHATPVAEKSAVINFELNLEQPSPVLLKSIADPSPSTEAPCINLDSSVEDTSTQAIPAQPANKPTGIGQFQSNPFKCSLSPIGVLRLRYYGKDQSYRFKQVTKNIYHATPNAQRSALVDFDRSNEQPSLILLQKKASQMPTDMEAPKTKRSARQVCFDLMMNSKLEVPLARFNSKSRPLKHKRTSEKTAKSKNAPTEPQPTFGNNSMRTRSTSVRSANLSKSAKISTAPRSTLESLAEHPKRNRNPKVKSLNLRRSSKRSTVTSRLQAQERPKSLVLQPGKWQKTLNALRRTNLLGNRSALLRESKDFENSVQFIGETARIGCRKSIYIKLENSAHSPIACSVEEWRTRVLQRCQQNAPLPFAELYTAERLQRCRKIGEGAYGEVFMFSAASNPQQQTVLKVIPIEGLLEVNGEVQKTFEQIYPEIVISTELCRLNDETKRQSSTSGFVPIQRIACVQGAYPANLIKLWEAYDAAKESENDHPDMFQNTQLYIAMELGDGGQDLEAFIFNNAEQAYYALQQLVLTLAVAEVELQFEHRDLHWGNILLMPTPLKHQKYKLNGKELTVPTKGVKLTIIDYTLSRMTVDGCCLYNDLASDEDLFTATGDYQFDIYRMMRDVLGNNWESFAPKTNVFWISYVVSKLIDGVNYKSPRTKTHQHYMTKLTQFSNVALNFSSALECARHLRKDA